MGHPAQVNRRGHPGLARLRLAWSATALLALLRRWWGFFVVTAAVLGLGYFKAAIGWGLLPVLWASSLPLQFALPVLLAHAGLAVALAWGLREALLPSRWLLAERALPLNWMQRARADLAVVALAQSPLYLLYLASFVSWRTVDPAWLRGHWGRGLVFVFASVGLSLAASCALLAWRRQPPRARRLDHSVTRVRPRAGRVFALLVLPLWRGPARPLAWNLALGTAGLVGCLGLARAFPADADWCLAGYAFIAMVSCTRNHALALRCYAPLVAASQALPLPPRFWLRSLRWLALLPVLGTWLPLMALLLGGPWTLRPMIAGLYLMAAFAAPSAQMWAPSMQSEARASRWLLALVLWVALATEMLRG